MFTVLIVIPVVVVLCYAGYKYMQKYYPVKLEAWLKAIRGTIES